MMAPIIVLLLAMLIPLGTPVGAIDWSGVSNSAPNGVPSGGGWGSTDYNVSANLDWATVGYRFSVVNKTTGQVKSGTTVKDIYLTGENNFSYAIGAARATTPRPKSVLRQGYTSSYSTYTKYSTSTSNVVLDMRDKAHSDISYLPTNPFLPSQPGGGNGQPTIGEWCQADYGANLSALFKGAGICDKGTDALTEGTDIVLVEPLFFLKIDGNFVVLTLTEIAMYEYAQYRAGVASAYGKVASGGINNILIMSNQKYPALLREEGDAGLNASKFWITGDMVDIYNSNGSISSELTSGKFNYTDRNGTSQKDQSIATTLSGQYILSPIYIITRGYGVGVAWDGSSTTPPENAEPYVLSVNCRINGYGLFSRMRCAYLFVWE